MKRYHLILKILINIMAVVFMAIGKDAELAGKIADFTRLSGENFDLSSFMLCSFIGGILLIYIYYPIRNEYLNRKIKNRKEQLEVAISAYHDLYCKVVGEEFGIKDLKLNVRKFKKQKFYRKPYREWFNSDYIYFEVNDYPFLKNYGTNDKYKFKMSPKPEGLIGVTYERQEMLYDDKLTSRWAEFNLTKSHLNKPAIAHTNFAICKPFIKINDKIDTIVSFDTKQNVDKSNLTDKTSTEKKLLEYSDIFGKLITNYK